MSMSIQLQKLSLKAKLFRGLGDSTRLSILESLREGEKTTSQIVKASGQSQSNISNHLSCLLDCGLVKNRRQGKNIFYSLGDKKVSKLLEESDAILSELARGIYACVNYNRRIPKKRRESQMKKLDNKMIKEELKLKEDKVDDEIDITCDCCNESPTTQPVTTRKEDRRMSLR